MIKFTINYSFPFLFLPLTPLFAGRCRRLWFSVNLIAAFFSLPLAPLFGCVLCVYIMGECVCLCVRAVCARGLCVLVRMWVRVLVCEGTRVCGYLDGRVFVVNWEDSGCRLISWWLVNHSCIVWFCFVDRLLSLSARSLSSNLKMVLFICPREVSFVGDSRSFLSSSLSMSTKPIDDLPIELFLWLI